MPSSNYPFVQTMPPIDFLKLTMKHKTAHHSICEAVISRKVHFLARQLITRLIDCSVFQCDIQEKANKTTNTTIKVYQMAACCEILLRQFLTDFSFVLL